MIRDGLDSHLREHGGLEGLARKIGQGDPLAYRFEPADNDNALPPRSWWTSAANLVSVPGGKPWLSAAPRTLSIVRAMPAATGNQISRKSDNLRGDCTFLGFGS